MVFDCVMDIVILIKIIDDSNNDDGDHDGIDGKDHGI